MFPITHHIMTLLVLTLLAYNLSAAKEKKRIRYFSTERPRIDYLNKAFFEYMNFTSKRYGRHDVFYYAAVHGHVLVPIDNTFKAHFYFFELLTNVYKRGFIEMHMTVCDLMQKDKFFGTAIRKNNFPSTCPIPPGKYHFENMTIALDQIPRGFPFTKGRIYGNMTAGKNQEVIASGHIDLELKEATVIVQ